MPFVPRFRYPVGYNQCDPTVPREKKEEVCFLRPWARVDNSCDELLKNFSPEELQMRLKAETLQYKTKHVQHNKAQKYALSARKNFTRKSYLPKAFIDERGNVKTSKNTNVVFGNSGSIIGLSYKNNCSDSILVNSSRASGVPGPAMNLYLDKSVPVVNFGNQRRTYRGGNLTTNVNGANLCSTTTTIDGNGDITVNVDVDVNVNTPQNSWQVHVLLNNVLLNGINNSITTTFIDLGEFWDHNTQPFLYYTSNPAVETDLIILTALENIPSEYAQLDEIHTVSERSKVFSLQNVPIPRFVKFQLVNKTNTPSSYTLKLGYWGDPDSNSHI